MVKAACGFPSHWPAFPILRMQSNKKGLRDFGAQLTRRLFQVLHWVLLRWFEIGHIRPTYKKFFLKRFNSEDVIVKTLIDAIGSQALVNQLVFSYDHSGVGNGPEEASDRIKVAVFKSMNLVVLLFHNVSSKYPADMRNFFAVSYHVQVHTIPAHLDFGGIANLDACPLEKNHGRSRQMLKNIMGINPEVFLLMSFFCHERIPNVF